MRNLGLALRLGISAALLYWVLAGVDFPRLGQMIGEISPASLVGALFVYFIGVIVIGAARWKLLMSSQGFSAPFPYLIESYLVATFFNNVLPTNIGGDVFRIKDGARYTDSKTLSTAIIFVDRLIGFAALFALAAGAFAFSGPIMEALRGILWIGIVVLAGSLTTVLLYPEIVSFSVKPLYRLESDWVSQRIEIVTTALFRFRREISSVLKALLVSILIQSSVVFFYFVIATAMDIPLTLASCFLVTPLVLVAQLVPSINGFGVRESAFVLLFGTLGLSPEQALSLSFVSTGAIIMLSLAGGALYAARKPQPA